MYPAQFEYYAPTTVNEALALLAQNADARVLAGGHSLLPQMKIRLAAPPVLVDIGRIADLRGISDAGNMVVIGALTTHHQVETSLVLREACPLLPEVASHIGDRQVRNRGTIGGSLSHADPAADYPAAMLALGAEIQAQGTGGTRTIKADEFFKGLFHTALNSGEILTAVRVPKTNGPGEAVAYAKFPHPASRYAVVGVAVWVKLENDNVSDVRIGITGATAAAARATKTENALKGKHVHAADADAAAKLAADGLTTIGDLFASADYRAHLVNVLTARALRTAFARAQGM